MPADFLEKTLETIIHESYDECIKRGFPELYANRKRQFNVPDIGFIDIFSFEIRDDILYCKIIELKREKLTDQCFWQLCKYHHSILCLTFRHFKEVKIELILVGNDLDSKIFHLADLNVDMRFIVYSYSATGITFSELNKGLGDYYSSDDPQSSVPLEFSNRLKSFL